MNTAVRMVITAVMALALAAPAAVAQMGGGMGPPPGGSKGGMRPPGGGGRGGPPGKAGRPKGDEFNPATFSCLDYTNGAGENATNRLRSVIARVWMQGNLTGLHRANGDLTFSDAAADSAALADSLDSACRAFPAASILAIGVANLAKAPLKMPDEIFGGIKISDYTCKAHLAAKAGGSGDAIRSDIAEMWAFAFIQGYKLAHNAEVAVPMDAKPQVVGAVLRACAANDSGRFMDLTAQVADKLKIQ